MNGVIIALGVFASIFGIIYVFLITRHRERIALIEKGADASIFGTNSFTSYPTLKFGMLFVGVGLGILIGNFLEEHYDFDKGAAYLSMVFLLGGISLVLNFIIEKSIMKDETK